jgi:type VI secretion system secreted protein Hcp
MKDIHVKFDGPSIETESLDAGRPGWIQCHYYTHNIVQPRSATASTAGGHTSERTRHGVVTLVKELDLASPMLFQHCSGGTTFDEVTIEFYRANDNGARVMYHQIKLKHVIIASVTTNCYRGIPKEGLTLKYAAIQWLYNQETIGGKLAGKTAGAWSLTHNNKTYTA